MIKKFNEYIKEENEAGGGASTAASPGSGTAVGGPGSGDAGMTFTSAMGVSVSGGDSGTAFATNSNVAGMGAIKSPQPSSTPGDVKGSKKGSGDIGSVGGTFMKQAAGKKKKKKKKSKSAQKRNQTAQSIDKLYTTQYSQTDKGDGKIIQNWKTYKESLNESYMAKGNEVEVTYEDDEDFGKKGIITKGFGQDGDFVTIKIDNNEVTKNVSSLLDLTIRSHNESLKDKMTPKSNNDIRKSLEDKGGKKFVLKDGKEVWVYKKHFSSPDSPFILCVVDEDNKKYFKWKKFDFKDEDIEFLTNWDKTLNESLRDKMTGKSDDEIEKALYKKYDKETADKLLDLFNNHDDFTFGSNLVTVGKVQMRPARFLANMDKYIEKYLK